MTEKELINACQDNQREAQFELVRLFAPRLLAVCNRYVPSGLEGEDTLQDAFIQIFAKLEQYDPEKGSLWGWLRQVTINSALKKHRLVGRWHLNSVGTEELNGIAGLDQDLNRLETEEIESLIHQLPEGQREVFNLVGVEGYSHDECADMLGMATGTSRAYLTRARKRLQEMISQMETTRV
ncbi:MAG: sigma-70 family RNA polymerase sigma factor [Saprospiraceae bacterium]|nr:sigma-70 family RNA polymerase sigma factor [Saprospiraceae bacterium]